MNASDIASLVRDARSCRRFVEADPIPAELLLQLIDIARLAPSSRNQQALRFLVLSSPADRERIFPFFKWAAALDWSGPQPGERATGYIIFLRRVGAQTAHDAGIAAMTIKLAAAAAGYASCIMGGIDRPGLHKALGLGPETEIDIAVALGRAGEKVVIEPLAPGAPVAYWHDSDDVHHVPKLGLADLLHHAGPVR
jgi:nitroreductase